MTPTLRSAAGHYAHLRSFSDVRAPALTSLDAGGLALHPYVMRCITLRAQAVASLTYVMESGRVAPIPSRVLSLCEVSLCTHGAAWIERRTMRVLNPSAMSVEADPQRGITAHVWRASGLTRRYTPDDVIYIALWSPTSDVGPGLAPLRVAQESARTALAAEMFTAQFFSQGALPPVIIEPPEGAMLTDADADAIRAVWQRLVSGVRNAWRALVLRRSMRITALDMPALDKLAMADVDDIALRRIAAAFGVPVTMITDAANYATAKEHRVSFWRDTVLPDAELIAEAFSAHSNERIAINYDDIEALAEDVAEQRRSVIELHQAGIVSTDEARAMIGIAAQEEQPAQSDASALRDALEELDAWRRKSAARGEVCAEFELRAMPREWARVVRALAERGHDPFAWARHIKAGRPVRDKDERDLAAAVAAVMDEHVAHEDGEWDAEAFARDLRARLGQALFAAAIDSAVAAMIQTAAYADAEAAYDFAARWADEYGYDLVRGITETSARRIRETLEAARRNDWPRETIIERLARIFGRARAETIAATELTRAYSQGTEIARQILADAGVEREHVWRTAADEMVCPICAPRNGTYRGTLWSELPPAHPNCRCWTTLEPVRRKR